MCARVNLKIMLQEIPRELWVSGPTHNPPLQAVESPESDLSYLQIIPRLQQVLQPKPQPFARAPPEEREKIDSQLQTVLKMIKDLEEQSGICRDDKLYDALYEDHGIGRKQVARLIATLMKKGSIHSRKPGYYTLA